MNQQQFKTNIKCGACVNAVTPHLNEVVGEGNWEVDLKSPDRILTIAKPNMANDVREALKKAGYEGTLTN